MTWREYEGTGIELRASESESRRFGLSMARLVIGTGITPDAAAPRVRALLRDAAEDLVIVRYPSEGARLGAAIAASGRIMIPADVLLYWDAAASALADLAEPSPQGRVTVEVAESAGPDVLAAVETVVADSFHGYGNHYTANPRLDRDLALAGYIEWAASTVQRDPANALILRLDGHPSGMATLAVDESAGEAEILLAGLTSAAQGRGLYPLLLKAVGQQAMARGCPRVTISTQAHNIRVQRAWAKAGFRPFAAITTVHAMTPGVLEESDQS